MKKPEKANTEDNMSEAEKANRAIMIEEARIQRALLELGYYAYRIQFQPNDGAASLRIEARPGCKGDEDLIFRNQFPA